RDYVLRTMRQRMGANIPIGAVAALGVQKIVPLTLPGAGGSATFALALQINGSAGSTAAIENVLRNDWAISISLNFALSRFIDALRAKFGGALPAPYGANPVTLDRRTVCLVDSPLGCIATATRRVLLRRITVNFLTGSLSLQGTLGVAFDGPFGFEVDADWS